MCGLKSVGKSLMLLTFPINMMNMNMFVGFWISLL